MFPWFGSPLRMEHHPQGPTTDHNSSVTACWYGVAVQSQRGRHKYATASSVRPDDGDEFNQISFHQPVAD